VVKVLSLLEFKDAWKWKLREYKVVVGEEIAYLYNQEGKLLTATNFICKFDRLDMRKFWIQCIHKLTQLEPEIIKRKIDKKFEIKDRLVKIYSIAITNEDFFKKRFRWIRLRNQVSILLSPKSNDFPPGYYYAELKKARNMDFKFINTDPVDLLVDFFFSLECYIGKEESVHTLSQAWHDDFWLYGDRKYPETISKYNVEQTYEEYATLQMIQVFNDSQRTTFMEVLEFFRKVGENKSYIMEILLKDPHFKIDENEYVIYTPTKPQELRENVL